MSFSETYLRDHKALLIEFLKGGFAPNVILLREFDYKKAGIILDGLHFSAWVLLGHIRARHTDLLNFMKDPDKDQNYWPEAFWPKNYQPQSRREWDQIIDRYEEDLEEMINLIRNPDVDVLKQNKDGKNITWAALTVLHHTGYHIGQLKTIGRQLGVW